jgi:glyoxylase-like metal-dependent hydrolase (beta-lactamase superfamily II)
LSSRERQAAVREEAGVQRANDDRQPGEEGDQERPREIEPGLWSIPLPLPFALRSANVYLTDDGDGGWTLIDAGFGLPADEAALRAGLAAAGVSLADVTALLITHAHPDHIGLSGPIHEESGAPVYLLAGEEAQMYRVWSAPADPRTDPLIAVAEMYAAHGLSAQAAAGAAGGTRRLRQILRIAPAKATHPLRDGDELRLGRWCYRVLWTPGHSDYHMCLLRDDGLFFSGDHILPGITPNIGWYPDARPDPLADYLVALHKVRDLPVRLVLPGHRAPFTDLAARVDELREHHRERAEQIRTLLAASEGGMTAAAVAAALFGARLQGVDDLRFAVAEMVAHLEHLRLGGCVALERRGGLAIYRVGDVDGAAAALAS